MSGKKYLHYVLYNYVLFSIVVQKLIGGSTTTTTTIVSLPQTQTVSYVPTATTRLPTPTPVQG